MFTPVHAFANYLFAVPIRKRMDVIALLVASVLPDLEGLYYMPAAYGACGGDDACAAAYPSHYMLHSIFGAMTIIAPVTVGLIWALKKYGLLKKADYKLAYLSALFGGLLHLLADVTYHTGADALYLLWPSQQQFSFAFGGSDMLWTALGGLGLVTFVWFEKRRIQKGLLALRIS
jgi:membrane-bound metal-dependent hydrolase YbcI (DUF457 family)